jgi:hypothetical protein
MENSIGQPPIEVSLNQPGTEQGQRQSASAFAVIGSVLQRPRQFFSEIRTGIDLPKKMWALALTGTVFTAIYGAMLGSGHPILSLNVAIAVPFLFLTSLVTCIPVMYLFDVLTGSQRSLIQMITVLLTSFCAMASVFFSFAPLMVVFSLTADLLQFFWLNVCIIAMATVVGLLYMIQGAMQTAIVDTDHPLHKVNQQLHFLWVTLFLIVAIEIAWGMLDFYQHTGGMLTPLINTWIR